MPEARRPVIWSSDARADLSDIWSYYAEIAGQQVADSIVRDIGAACRMLEDHPFAGRDRAEVRPGLRSVAANPHVVFYRIRNDTAQIVRVLDGRRDLDEIFAQEPDGE